MEVPDGVCYQDFKASYPTRDPSACRYLHITWTISITKRINKFKPQYMDKLHENYFIHTSFDPNTNIFLNILKVFFAFQKKNDQKYTLKTKLFVQPIPMWMEFIFLHIWIIGVFISMDETPCITRVATRKKVN